MSSDPGPRTVVIGDLVASRAADDRRGLHASLAATIVDVNRRWQADLRITVGDEFQGTVGSLGVATEIGLAMRLALLPAHDVRVGIGRGATAVLDRGAAIEDGPGWWVARAAIEEVATREGRPPTRSSRSAFRSSDPGEASVVAAVDAALLARDELVGAMDGRSLSVLRGLLSGSTQREIAEAEGVSASAVSQRVRHDGIGVVVAMSSWLATMT